MIEQVEQIIADLPVDEGLEGLPHYCRCRCPGILAAANGAHDVRALQQVVRRYFVSSLGDDAALTLSSIYMDDYDFVGAIRMLRKIVEPYPNPSVSMVDVYARLAICQALMGETKQAQDALARARELPADSQSVNLDDIHSLIENDIDVNPRNRDQSGLVSMLANRNRSGLMPALPSGILENDLTVVWQYHYLLSAKRWTDLQKTQPIFGPDSASRVRKTVTSREKQLIEKWKQRGWRPTGHLLFDQGRVYFKTMFDLTVWDSSADSNDVVWRPLWRNEYKMDDLTSAMMEVRRTFNRRGQLRNTKNGHDSSSEVQLFADRVSSQMSIQDGILYTIEGTKFDWTPRNRSRRQRLRYNVPKRRSRTNRLTAYDARTGRLLWTLPPLNEEENTSVPAMGRWGRRTRMDQFGWLYVRTSPLCWTGNCCGQSWWRHFSVRAGSQTTGQNSLEFVSVRRILVGCKSSCTG